MGTLLNCRDLVRNVAGMTPGFGWIELGSFFGFTNLNVRLDFYGQVTGAGGTGTVDFDQNADLSAAMAAVVDSKFKLNQEDYWNNFPLLDFQQGLFQLDAATDGTDSVDLGADLIGITFGQGRYGPNNLDLGVTIEQAGSAFGWGGAPVPGFVSGTPITLEQIWVSTYDIFNNATLGGNDVARIITDLNDFTSPITINRTASGITGDYLGTSFTLEYNISYILTFT